MLEVSYKTVRTPLLDIAYLEAGPADGKPILLLHGWPDSPRTWRGRCRTRWLNGAGAS